MRQYRKKSSIFSTCSTTFKLSNMEEMICASQYLTVATEVSVNIIHKNSHRLLKFSAKCLKIFCFELKFLMKSSIIQSKNIFNRQLLQVHNIDTGFYLRYWMEMNRILEILWHLSCISIPVNKESFISNVAFYINN